MAIGSAYVPRMGERGDNQERSRARPLRDNEEKYNGLRSLGDSMVRKVANIQKDTDY